MTQSLSNVILMLFPILAYIYSYSNWNLIDFKENGNSNFATMVKIFGNSSLFLHTDIEIVLDVISKKWTVSRNILLSDMEDSECNPLIPYSL